jgi:glyoxylase-like metal-dependent hydrolase (beta-lactamase superfamily II)
MNKVLRYELGSMELYSITDGTFRLDGGAMFGVVPRVIWEKMNPPDEANRILMGLNPLLIISQGKKVLVDTGIGEKLDSKSSEIYAVDRTYSLMDSLRDIGLAAADIDVVVNTHLHFDHAGGNTKKDEKGTVVPAFPNAQYVIAKGEWEDAVLPNRRSRKSYTEDDFGPLKSAGRLKLVEGKIEIAPGVWTYPTPGHNEHHQSVYFESNGEKGIYLGDLIPTSSHIPLPYVMGYDLFPATTVDTKKELLDTAYHEGWLLVFEHDPVVRWGRLERKGDRYILRSEDQS